MVWKQNGRHEHRARRETSDNKRETRIRWARPVQMKNGANTHTVDTREYMDEHGAAIAFRRFSFYITVCSFALDSANSGLFADIDTHSQNINTFFIGRSSVLFSFGSTTSLCRLLWYLKRDSFFAPKWVLDRSHTRSLTGCTTLHSLLVFGFRLRRKLTVFDLIVSINGGDLVYGMRPD